MDCESVVAPSTTADGDDDDEAIRISEAADCTENCYGVMKEVEKLINENMELSATKNALNVVKNDLIRKLDDVTG
ncbi:putative jnk/sapk-associated protein [Fasciolopsis buskii]|uniref:Putative jnk/sapk-associated protein n=1 Tax=Fasciolopsis buskii TaxID=27845 RepID=A0A8E0VFC4_9TREM|nr:putative jnk/sapk-associated protein [Fasciolopsis buski]